LAAAAPELAGVAVETVAAVDIAEGGTDSGDVAVGSDAAASTIAAAGS